MEFVFLPSDKLNKSNPDYDMEDFWYGFKNLIKNYYKDIKDDNNILFSININFISEILNTLQKEQKYEVIYNKIYLYIISFCKALINQYETTTVSNKSYFFSWIKRYNKIPNVKKIEYNESYNKNKLFDNISEEELFYIKLKFIAAYGNEVGDSISFLLPAGRGEGRCCRRSSFGRPLCVYCRLLLRQFQSTFFWC